MQRPTAKLILALSALWALPGFAASLDAARDLMAQNRFAEAREALQPLARSGNADAEELLGILYALGLGVEQDPVRAFDWYLRAAMKGHPAAQSGVGRAYETGQGLPAPDPLRAYVWYRLSVIGGDPDAEANLQEVARTLTAEEIAHGNTLVEDYRAWLYPLR